MTDVSSTSIIDTMTTVTDTSAVVEIANRSRLIRTSLSERLEDQSPDHLYDSIRSSIESTGGRLPATALMLVGEMLAEDHVSDESLLSAAMSVEAVHAVSLFHGSLVTEGRRHGRITGDFDRETALLAGDVLFPLSLELLLEADGMGSDRRWCVELLLDACQSFSEGHSLACSVRKRDSVPLGAYLEVARLLSGELFESAARLGAIIADSDPETIERSATFGRRLGIAAFLCRDFLFLSGLDPSDRVGNFELTVSPDTVPGQDEHAMMDKSVNFPASHKINQLDSVTRLEFACRHTDTFVQHAANILTAFPETASQERLNSLCGVLNKRIHGCYS